MASDLLKTLRKVEDGRQNMIKNVRTALGINVPDDVSFTTLSQYIGTYTQDFTGIFQSSDDSTTWERPSEWPDCYNIIKNLPLYNNKKPNYIVLLKTDDATTTFPANTGNTYYGNGAINPVKLAQNVNKIVTSDGAEYTDLSVEVVHTWDTTKDVVIESGEYAGTYRWFVVYTDYLYYTTLAGLPVAEMLIYYSGSSTPSNNSICGSSNRGNIFCQNIINFEIMPEYNNTTIGVGSLGMFQYSFIDCYKLKRFVLNKISSFSPGSTNGSHMQNWPEIEEIHYGNVSYFHSSIIKNATKLKYLQTKYSGTISLPVLPSIKVLNIPNATLDVAVVEGIPGLLPEDCELTFKGFSYNIPIYWTSNRGFKTFSTDQLILARNHYNIRTYDTRPLILTGALVTTDSTNAYSIQNCINFKELLLNTGWLNRLDLSTCKLDHSNVLDIINNLMDLNAVTDPIYNPFIKLSQYNKDLLTEADLQKAISKGWVIE